MTCSRSSDVAPGASSSTGSMPTARSRRLEAASKSRMTGPATVRYITVDRLRARASGIGRAMARFFGASSPTTICRTVEKTRTRATAMVRLIAYGRPVTPSSSASDYPDERLTRIPDQQGGHRDAELRPGEGERQPRRDVEGPARRGVALVGQLAQPGPVDRDVGELLGDEVAGRDGEEHDQGEADGDEHRGVHSSRAFTRYSGFVEGPIYAIRGYGRPGAPAAGLGAGGVRSTDTNQEKPTDGHEPAISNDPHHLRPRRYRGPRRGPRHRGERAAGLGRQARQRIHHRAPARSSRSTRSSPAATKA